MQLPSDAKSSATSRGQEWPAVIGDYIIVNEAVSSGQLRQVVISCGQQLLSYTASTVVPIKQVECTSHTARHIVYIIRRTLWDVHCTTYTVVYIQCTSNIRSS